MNNAKILVADDIKQNVKLLRVILTAVEYDVIEAYDGNEALEKARTENPDLILLDIMMPKLTGYEVCQRLRADGATKNIPIIMITALHEMDDRIKGIEAGADDFVSKPFNKTELLARVKSLLQMKHEAVKKDETTILDTIIPDLAEGVVITDGQWKIQNINQAARELLNIRETDTKNADLLQYLSPMTLSIPVDKLINTQEKITDFQILHSNTKMTKIFDDAGKLLGVVLIIRKEK
ncbi:MAG: response regulator [Planctomycetota bacterium]|nr:response regulator [Planctomycetota bacterium]MDE2215975.1 response regulator [Planctomycetota bacterium]